MGGGNQEIPQNILLKKEPEQKFYCFLAIEIPTTLILKKVYCLFFRYDPRLKDSLSGKERKVRFKTFHKLLGLVTYLDWFMIIITTLTTVSMMFETPKYRVMENSILQIMDYAFVFAMGIELSLKILAEGLLFTPKALVKDVSGFLGKSCFIFIILNHIFPTLNLYLP